MMFEVSRRSFVTGLIALVAAPAIVKATSLMPVRPQRLILWGDGVHDDTEALQAITDGHSNWVVQKTDGICEVRGGMLHVPKGRFRISSLNVSGLSGARGVGPGTSILSPNPDGLFLY